MPPIDRLPNSVGQGNTVGLPRIGSRRKSSFFRPTNFYPLEDFKDDKLASGLESLPLILLIDICDYLNSDDLQSLCVCLTLMYLPAAIQLYRKIIITSQVSLSKVARKKFSTTRRNLGTVIHVSKFLSLLLVLRCNRKISQNVKSLVFCVDSEIDWNFKIENRSILSLLEECLCITRLSTFFCRSLPSLKKRLLLPQRSTIQSLTICLSDYDFDYSFITLRRLKILYVSDLKHRTQFEQLAERIVSYLRNLTSLEFEIMEDRSHSLNALNDFNLNNCDAPWISFFQGLRGLEKCLCIETLGLDGFIGSKGRDIAYILKEALDLSYLKVLLLNLKEVSHHHETHFNAKTTFLENFSSFTSNLTQLCINPTFDCLSCQHHSIMSALAENIPNKLDILLIIFESPNQQFRSSLQDIIIEFQKKLRYLKLYDKSKEASDKVFLKRNVGDLQASIYEHAVFYDSQWLSIFTDGYFPGLHPIVINDYMESFIEKSHDEIGKFLNGEKDFRTVSRYDMFVTSLPRLKILSIFNIVLMIRCGRAFLVLNGKYIPIGTGTIS